jgi:ELWxxDGT repeat protein
MIFPATSTAEGAEFWQSDGTGPNTVLFKDINPGPDSSDAILFLNGFNATDINSFHTNLFNGVIFMQAKTPDAGTELWKTNGTPAGTVRVKDINPGVDSSMTVDSLTYFYTAGSFYFSATDGSTGYELWKTDGTDPNTSRVFDINPGAASSRPQFITQFNGIILFTATDGDNSGNLRDLFRLDGTFSPLPLTLLNFTGSVYNKSVHLNWTTVTEINTAYFEVERGSSNSRFETIGKVNAIGNSTDKKEYSYEDINAMNGSANKIFYRLKMVDADGKFTYSKVITVSNFNVDGLVTYPNPVKDELKLSFYSRENNVLTLNFLDESGKKVLSRQLNAVAGNNTYLLNVGQLPKGSYYIKVVTNDGIQTAKLIKN